MPTSTFVGLATGSGQNVSITNLFSTLVSSTITLVGNQAAIDVTGVGHLICNNATLLTIQGLLGGVEGQELLIESIGAGQVNLAYQSGSAAAIDQLTNFVTSGPTPLAATFGKARYIYRSSKWRLANHEQGIAIVVAHAAGNFVGNGSMTWTVEAADQVTYRYYLQGNQLTVFLSIQNSSVGGTPNTQLLVTLPEGFTVGGGSRSDGYGLDNNVATSTRVFYVGAGTQIAFQRFDGANWTASANLTGVETSVVGQLI